MAFSRCTSLLPALLLLTSLGCADVDSEGPRTDAPAAEPLTGSDTTAAGADTVPEASGRADTAQRALPALFSIMSALEGAMARLDRGLWAERFDTIAAGARAVADHPPIPAAEGERIRSVLGDDMARFQELDRTVHDLAVRVAEGADRRALGPVLEAQAQLRSGCVTCHTEFRERLRQGLR